MTKTTKRILTAVVAIALLGGAGLGGYFWYTKPAAAPVGQTLKIERGSMTETAAASGKIQPAVQVDVKSRVAGEVLVVLIKEGDRVEAGQLLVRLDKTDAERALSSAKVARDRARANLYSAQASVNVADLDRKNNETTQGIAEKSAELGLSTSDSARVAAHTSNVSVANLKLKQAQANASQLDLQTAELAVQDAETKLTQTDLFAPMAGTVLSLSVEKGSIISSAFTNVSGGSAVLTIADLSDLRIVASVDEAQISRVSPGQKVDIRVDAYPSRVFEGKVDRVSPLGVEASSVVTFDVEIQVTDKDAALLRSGMSADVEIITVEQNDVLLVPLGAIQSKGKKRLVTLANGETRPIETGATDGTLMIVLKGLEEGDEIMLSAPAATAGAGTAKAQSGQNNPMRSMGVGGPR